MDWSTLRVVDLIEVILISAGTLSPTAKKWVRQSSNSVIWEISNQMQISSISQEGDLAVTAPMITVTTSCLLLLWLAIPYFYELPIYSGKLNLSSKSLPLLNFNKIFHKSLLVLSSHDHNMTAEGEHPCKTSISEYISIITRFNAKVRIKSPPQEGWPNKLFSLHKVSFLFSTDQNTTHVCLSGHCFCRSAFCVILQILPDLFELEAKFRSHTNLK